MRPTALVALLAALLTIVLAGDAHAARTVVRIAGQAAVHVSPGGPAARAGGDMLAEHGAAWVVKRRGSWLGIPTSQRRNGKLGWIRRTPEMRLTTTRLLAQVDLSKRRVRVTKGGRHLFRAAVAVGASRSPSPIARTSVAEHIRVTASSRYSTRAFGPKIIALRLWQPLASPGLPRGGVMAFHGGSRPSVGRAVSGGCFRMRNRAVRRLAQLLPPGTPVIIRR